MNDAPPPPEASVTAPSRVSWVWLVPLVAAALAGYLGWQTLASRGPLITIRFATGQGLTAGRTEVEHKAVEIGTVESVVLSKDFRHVIARVRMDKRAAPLLTSHARFWVVRPRFSLTQPSGLQTLISGSYIAVDPGLPGGKPQRHFQGLPLPPGVRSDQPGETFTLRAPRLNWLRIGAPVFYRDIVVGQLLDYRESGMGQPIVMHVFIKAPYDHYVRAATHFWNVTGLSMNFGPEGVHLAVESVEALLAGGIEFGNAGTTGQSPEAKPDAVFKLYQDFDAAKNAGYRDNIPYVAYFRQSVAGLQPGSPVTLYGIRIGTVTGTALQLDPKTDRPRVRVAFDVQPARVVVPSAIPKIDPLRVTRHLVAMGMRARVDTSNMLTGQEEIGLDMVADAPEASVATQDGRIVWPSATGGLQTLTDSLGEIVAKLRALPLDKMGANADGLLASLHQLSTTLDHDLGPVATQLPAVARDLQTTLLRADRLLASVQAGYGANSKVEQDLADVTSETAKTMRSVRELANYLNRHPASLVWGR